MPNGESRYHAEVKGFFEGREIRVNVFSDSLISLFRDIHSAVGYLVNPTKVEENGQSLPPVQPPAQPPKPSPKAPVPTEVPVCASCGSSQAMELISFRDKTTGEPRQAWKCQECSKWHWDN